MQGGAATPAGIVAAPNAHSRHLNRVAKFLRVHDPGESWLAGDGKICRTVSIPELGGAKVGGERGDSVHVGTVIDILRFGTNETRIDRTTARWDIRLIKGNKNSSCAA